MALPLVHNIETSARFNLPGTYQQYRANFDPVGFVQAGEFYTHIDEVLQTNYVEKYVECRTRSWFARNKSSNEVRVFTNACKLRWCPLCTQARRSWITKQVAQWMKSAIYPKFLTVTLKHSDAPLKHQIDSLYNYFKKFRNSKKIRNDMTGGVWFFQVKKDKTGKSWHPHIHCIVSGNYMPQRLLSKLWLSITHTSKVVDIRPVRDKVKAANEVARYASMPADVRALSNDDRLELFECMKGRRVCGTFGGARGIELKPPKRTDSDQWQHIGSWRLVREMEPYDFRAQEIVKCWLTDTAISPLITLEILQKEINDQLIEYVIEKPAPYFPGFYDTS